MERRKIIRALVSLSLGLAFVWALNTLLAKPGDGPARASLGMDQGPGSAPVQKAAIQPDPRWLALAHRPAGQPAHRPTAALLTLNLNLTDQSLAGYVPTAAPLALRLERNGQVVAQATATPVPEAGGFFYLKTFYSGSPYSGVIQPGDRLWAVQGGTALSLTVPALSGLADQASNSVYGQAPTGASLQLYLFPFNQQGVVVTGTAGAGPLGFYNYSWDGTAVLRPRDSGYSVYPLDERRRVYIYYVTPYLAVQAGGNEFFLTAEPGQLATITATSPDGKIKAQAWNWTGADGGLNDIFYNYFGTSFNILTPGDTVQTEVDGQTFSTTVEAVTAHANRQAGQVRGQAPPGTGVRAWRFSGSLDPLPNGDLWSTAASDQVDVPVQGGIYTATLSLVGADYGAVLVRDAQGYDTFARFAVPFLAAPLGERLDVNFLSGQLDAVFSPVTITVRGLQGYLKDISHSRTGRYGEFPDYEFYEGQGMAASLESGDIITLTTPGSDPLAVQLPTLTAQVDQGAALVSGLAPPGAPVTVTLAVGIRRTALAGPEGHYRLDFSDLNLSPIFLFGRASLAMDRQVRVSRRFGVGLACPEIAVIYLRSNKLFTTQENCTATSVRLYDRLGRLKASTTNNGEVSLYDQNGAPVPILPGDLLEASAYDRMVRLTVPEFSAQLSPDGRLISGTATAGATLQVTILALSTLPYRLLEPIASYATTADRDGHYSLDLAAKTPVEPGQFAEVVLMHGDPYLVAYAGRPALLATLHSVLLRGYLEPVAAYSTTLKRLGWDTPMRDYAKSDGSLYSTTRKTIEPGDQLEVQGAGRVIKMSVPLLTARLDRKEWLVSGQAPPGGQVQVQLSGDSWGSETQILPIGAAGSFSATFPSAATFLGTVSGVASYTGSDGNTTLLQFGAPDWEFSLGERCFSGLGTEPQGPFTVTLQALTGTTEVVTRTAGLGFSPCFKQALAPGDRLMITDSTATQRLTLPELTASYDYAGHLLSGRALPGAEVLVQFSGYVGIDANSIVPPGASLGGGYQEIDRHTLAGPDGGYRMDLSDLHLAIPAYGFVRLELPGGIGVKRSFGVFGRPYFLPWIAK